MLVMKFNESIYNDQLLKIKNKQHKLDLWYTKIYEIDQVIQLCSKFTNINITHVIGIPEGFEQVVLNYMKSMTLPNYISYQLCYCDDYNNPNDYELRITSEYLDYKQFDKRNNILDQLMYNYGKPIIKVIIDPALYRRHKELTVYIKCYLMSNSEYIDRYNISYTKDISAGIICQFDIEPVNDTVDRAMNSITEFIENPYDSKLDIITARLEVYTNLKSAIQYLFKTNCDDINYKSFTVNHLIGRYGITINYLGNSFKDLYRIIDRRLQEVIDDILINKKYNEYYISVPFESREVFYNLAHEILAAKYAPKLNDNEVTPLYIDIQSNVLGISRTRINPFTFADRLSGDLKSLDSSCTSTADNLVEKCI